MSGPQSGSHHVTHVFISETVGGVVLLGMPGCGKGTQALQIQERYGVPEISTGDLLRDHVKRADELGQAAEPIMKAGDLVPDSLLNAMVAERLKQPDCHPGFILDGYPRTDAQAKYLDELMHTLGRRLPRVILLEVPVERLVDRLTERWNCSKCGAIYNEHLQPPKRAGLCDVDGAQLFHRGDDQKATVRHRIETYQHDTAPMIEHYRASGALFVVNADRRPEEIAAEIRGLLEFKVAA
jgi:adenylate kinase